MYSFNSIVRYSEVNKNGRLDPVSIVNYFQDCSTFQSESLDMGIEHLKGIDRAWVLNSWQIEILKDVSLMDEIEIGTWAYDAKGIYGYRNFVINSLDGKRLVNANSIWVYIEMSTGRPVKIKEEDVKAYKNEPKIKMTEYGRKIKTSGESREEVHFNIRKYHIDTNGHVNNGRYIQFAMEYLEDQIDVKAIRAEYKMPAKYGDKVIPYIFESDEEMVVALKNIQGMTYANIQFVYEIKNN